MTKINKFIKDTINQIDEMEKKKRKLQLLIAPRKVAAKLGVFSAEVGQPVPASFSPLLTKRTIRFINEANAALSPTTCLICPTSSFT